MMAALYFRDVRLGFRSGGGAMIAVLFFMSVIIMMPFAVGPDLKLLARLGPAFLWVGALLASLLGLERLFQADREDGSLDHFRLDADVPELALMVFVKCLAHWTVTGLPLVLAVPLFGLFLNMEPMAVLAAMATLAVGTPAIAFIGAVGAAAGVTLARGGLLVAVIVLPVIVPVLIFGVSAANAAVDPSQAFLPPFALLSALCLFFAVTGPFAAALFLKGLDE
jgi:heme exporter protein B